MPFKIFVLSAGIFRIPFPQFVVAILAGRCIRYFMWGILAVIYGAAVHEFLVNNIRSVGIFALGRSETLPITSELSITSSS